jgi:hypothetical protein
MQSDMKNWSLGEIVFLPRQTSKINKKYEYLMESRYICIRETTEGQRGILLKVLGETARKNIMMQSGKPFCKDEKNEDINSNTYYSFRFPSANELKDVLDILKKDETLLDKFEKIGMPINPNSTFWVRDTASRLYFLKEPQYYDATIGKHAATSDDETHNRLTIVYFYKSNINW